MSTTNQAIKVSIITATFGRSLLKRAVASVNNMSYKNWEHLVVYDGTRWKIDPSPFTHPNRKFLCSNKRGRYKDGGNMGKNAGVNNATGDYILFLDDDNYYTESGIENLVSELPESCPWAIFPIMRFGVRFIHKDISYGHVDGGHNSFH